MNIENGAQERKFIPFEDNHCSTTPLCFFDDYTLRPSSSPDNDDQLDLQTSTSHVFNRMPLLETLIYTRNHRLGKETRSMRESIKYY